MDSMTGVKHGDLIFNKAEPKVAKRRAYYLYEDEENFHLTFTYKEGYRYEIAEDLWEEEPYDFGISFAVPKENHQLVNLTNEPLKIGDILDHRKWNRNFMIVGFEEKMDEDGDMHMCALLEHYPIDAHDNPAYTNFIEVASLFKSYRLSYRIPHTIKM